MGRNRKPASGMRQLPGRAPILEACVPHVGQASRFRLLLFRPRYGVLQLIKKCLFPVAGYGTRFLPATKSMPKEMLPIVNKPLLQFGVEEALAAGLNEIGFVTGRGKRSIEDHFDISYELEHQIAGTDKERFLDSTRKLSRECSFAYTRQIEMRGLGHAILTGRVIVGDEPFGVVLPDDLCFGGPEDGSQSAGEGVLTQMVRLFRQFRCSIDAIEEVPHEDVRNYGIVAGEAIAPNLFRVQIGVPL